MNAKNEIHAVEIFSGSPMDAEILKSLLEDAKIEAFLKDEFTGTMFPWFTAAGGLGSVKIIVSNQDFDAARIVVEGFKVNRNEI